MVLIAVGSREGKNISFPGAYILSHREIVIESTWNVGYHHCQNWLVCPLKQSGTGSLLGAM